MVVLYKSKALTLLRLGYPQSSSSILKLFVVGDVKPSHFPLQNLLLCRHFNSEISETHHDFTVNYLINSCGLSPEGAISTSKWVELRSPKTADSVLSFLRNYGFSETQMSKMVRSCPHLLQLHPEKTLLPKLEFFASFGVSKKDLATTLQYEPKLLAMSLEKRIIPTYDFLRSMLSQKKVVSVFRHGSWIFVEGHSKKVAPNIKVLRESGMPQHCISMMLTCHPRALILKPKDFGQLVDEVKQMGFNLQKSTSVMAINALCAANRSTWNRSCEFYKRWCSVVKVLLLKGLINGIENVSLGSVLVPPEKCFLERFVARYTDEVPQLLSVYQGRVEVQDV